MNGFELTKFKIYGKDNDIDTNLVTFQHDQQIFFSNQKYITNNSHSKSIISWSASMGHLPTFPQISRH